MTEYMDHGRGLEMTTDQLRLGDVVQCFEGAWGTAIVQKVEEKQVTYYRPYGHSEDWSYTGGIICYSGLEVFSEPRNAFRTVKVYRREDVR